MYPEETICNVKDVMSTMGYLKYHILFRTKSLSCEAFQLAYFNMGYFQPIHIQEFARNGILFVVSVY